MISFREGLIGVTLTGLVGGLGFLGSLHWIRASRAVEPIQFLGRTRLAEEAFRVEHREYAGVSANLSDLCPRAVPSTWNTIPWDPECGSGPAGPWKSFDPQFREEATFQTAVVTSATGNLPRSSCLGEDGTGAVAYLAIAEQAIALTNRRFVTCSASHNVSME